MKRNLWQDSTSPEHPTGNASLGRESMGMWGCWGWWLGRSGGFCHPKMWLGAEDKTTSAVSAATAWQPHRDHGIPGPWLDHKGLQKSRLGGGGTDLWGRGGEILSWRCQWHHFPGNVAHRQDAGVLGKESLPAARAAGLTGLWGHGRRLERELRALDKIWGKSHT